MLLTVLHLQNLIACCSPETGELLNYANIASDIGISEMTVKKWISILERTGIVYLLQPYSASALNRAIKTPKYILGHRTCLLSDKMVDS